VGRWCRRSQQARSRVAKNEALQSLGVAIPLVAGLRRARAGEPDREHCFQNALAVLITKRQDWGNP